MDEVTIIFLSVTGGGLFIGLLSWWIGIRWQNWSNREGLRALVLCVGIGAGVGGLAFLVEWTSPTKTVFSTEVTGSVGAKVGAQAPIRTVTIPLETPGHLHTFHIIPDPGFGKEASIPVEIQVILFSSQGHMLRQKKLVFPLYRSSVRGGGTRTVWDGKEITYTPKAPGKYRLLVQPITVGIPTIRIVVSMHKEPQAKQSTNTK